MERETTQRVYWQKAFSVSECRKTACGLVDTDPQGALYSPEKLSTPCIHSPSPKQNKQPFHAARGLRTTTSISCKLLLASSPSRAACQENSGSFITQMQTLKSNGRKWACPQSVFSACRSRLRWRLWAFQVNGSYWSQVSTRIALQFWVPYFRLSTALISKYGKGPKFNKKTTLANCLQPGSQSEIPGPGASASPGYLPEIQILRPRPKPPESDALRYGPHSVF